MVNEGIAITGTGDVKQKVQWKAPSIVFSCRTRTGSGYGDFAYPRIQNEAGCDAAINRCKRTRFSWRL